MAKFDSENQPKERSPRGRDKRLLIIEALERQGQSEKEFYDLLVMAALGISEDESVAKLQPVAFTEMMKRLHPIPKQVAPVIEFDYPADGTLLEKAQAIEAGISDATIPPDIGIGLIQALANVAKVEEVTEIKERLERLEQLLEKGD